MSPLGIGFSALLLLVILVGLLKSAPRPLPYDDLRLEDARRFLKPFLQRADAGSLFVLERQSGRGFLQLAVTHRHGDHEHLEFGLPRADWCADNFDSVQKAIEGLGHSCRVETNEDNAAVPYFL